MGVAAQVLYPTTPFASIEGPIFSCVELDNFIYRMNLPAVLLNCTATLKIFDPFNRYLDVVVDKCIWEGEQFTYVPLISVFLIFHFHSVIQNNFVFNIF